MLHDFAYTFDGAEDARTYLREIALLWSVWIVGMAAVLLSHGGALILWSVGLLILLLSLGRPLLTRAEELVPVNESEVKAVRNALRGGTTRDRVLRELAYGTRPVQAALAIAGLSRRWVVTRHVVVVLTILGLLFVLLAPRS